MDRNAATTIETMARMSMGMKAAGLTGLTRTTAKSLDRYIWLVKARERHYRYAKALAPLLPTAADDPLPQISESVLLTHLRTEALTVEEDLSRDEATDEPGVALPGGGAGRQNDSPTERLSELIVTVNEKFGMACTDADIVWFEQQKQAVKDSDEVRVVALHNDRDQFHVVLERFAEDAIIDRHQANGVLFNAFFEKPGFREAL